jgi:FkbM family methyltransferase
VDAEILTVFNALIYLRERLHMRPHLYAEELEFLSFAAKRSPHSCAQILQDLWVLYELREKRGGLFVEFGACDGVTLSNTLLLEKTFGWQGALAEPARAWHEALRVNRNCYVSHKCVYRTDGARISFRETDIRELSTLEDLKNLDFHAPARDTGSQYDVETISLGNFLGEARAPKDIDYLSIDVEGAELDILKSFDFDSYRIKLITIEHNFADVRQDIFDLLSKFGYRRKFMSISMFDDWYVRPDLLPGRD